MRAWPGWAQHGTAVGLARRAGTPRGPTCPLPSPSHPRQLERLADSVAAEGNANVTERLAEQLTACGRNITITSGAAGLRAGSALLVPLLVVGLSLVLAELLLQP